MRSKSFNFHRVNLGLAIRDEGRLGSEKSGLGQIYITLFLIFALYLTLPIVDVPLLGLSISAPLFFVIALKCLLKPESPWFREYRSWILLAVLIWLGIFISAMANGMVSWGVDFNNDGFLSILRFAYFILVFVITVYFASQGNILAKTSKILAWGIFMLAILRLGEAFIFGRVGDLSQPQLLTQNSYGMLFSSFSPFVTLQLFDGKGIKKIWQVFRIIIVWGSAVINGSRSSWLAMGVGLVIVLFILIIKRPRQFAVFGAVLLFIVSVGAFTARLSPGIAQAVENRFSTMNSLETDKSYETRKVMNQKSINLFKNSPIIGVGAGRYRLESVSLDLPDILRYRSERYFNHISGHNSYLTYLAENGALGAIPLGVLILTLLFKGSKYPLDINNHGKYWTIALFIGFIQMSIHMWNLSTFSNTMNWFVYGLVGAMIVLANHKKVST